MSGGPEYPKQFRSDPHDPTSLRCRWRRRPDAAVMGPDRYCRNFARRAEMQFTGHWNAIPIARNLAVRFQALKLAYLLVQRQKGAV